MRELLTTISKQGLNNAIMNGDCRWNRRGEVRTFGISFPSGSHFLDRWRYFNFGGSVTTLEVRPRQSGLVPTFDEARQGFNNSMWIDVQTAQGGFVDNDQATLIQQRIEGSVWREYHKQKITVSFWVRGNVGTYAVGFESGGGGTGTGISKAFTVNAADTWEKKVIQFDMAAGDVDNVANTFNFDNGEGVRFQIALTCGVDRQAPVGKEGEWTFDNTGSTSALGVDGMSNDLYDAVGGIRFAGISIVRGWHKENTIKYQPFGGVGAIDETTFLERYYQDHFEDQLGVLDLSTRARMFVKFTTRMRTQPTIKLKDNDNSLGDFFDIVGFDGSVNASTGPTTVSTTEYWASWFHTIAETEAINRPAIFKHNRIEADAEL